MCFNQRTPFCSVRKRQPHHDRFRHLFIKNADFWIIENVLVDPHSQNHSANNPVKNDKPGRLPEKGGFNPAVRFSLLSVSAAKKHL